MQHATAVLSLLGCHFVLQQTPPYTRKPDGHKLVEEKCPQTSVWMFFFAHRGGRNCCNVFTSTVNHSLTLTRCVHSIAIFTSTWRRKSVAYRSGIEFLLLTSFLVVLLWSNTDRQTKHKIKKTSQRPLHIKSILFHVANSHIFFSKTFGFDLFFSEISTDNFTSS